MQYYSSGLNELRVMQCCRFVNPILPGIHLSLGELVLFFATVAVAVVVAAELISLAHLGFANAHKNFTAAWNSYISTPPK